MTSTGPLDSLADLARPRPLPLALSVRLAMSSIGQRPRKTTAAQDLGPVRPRE